ncbi:hypothetical protein RCH33_42 [Flavobacterium daejeonense]|nr:hypothetical protein RCH33_42 [Flavobacterium daejeonense]
MLILVVPKGAFTFIRLIATLEESVLKEKRQRESIKVL